MSSFGINLLSSNACAQPTIVQQIWSRMAKRGRFSRHNGMKGNPGKAPSTTESDMEGYIKRKQSNLACTDKQAFIYAVVKISQKYGLGISGRKQLWWFHPVYPSQWEVYQQLPLQVWLLYHICTLECTHSHNHTLSTSTCTQWQANCHPVLPTDYRDSPGPGPDIIEFPLPQTNHCRQTPSAFLAHNTALSIPERMASKLGDYKHSLGIPTEFLAWPQEARKWIHNKSPQGSTLWAVKKRTNSVLLCMDTWSCAFTARCWQHASIRHSKINSSKGISLP